MNSAEGLYVFAGTVLAVYLAPVAYAFGRDANDALPSRYRRPARNGARSQRHAGPPKALSSFRAGETRTLQPSSLTTRSTSTVPTSRWPSRAAVTLLVALLSTARKRTPSRLLLPTRPTPTRSGGRHLSLRRPPEPWWGVLNEELSVLNEEPSEQSGSADPSWTQSRGFEGAAVAGTDPNHSAVGVTTRRPCDEARIQRALISRSGLTHEPAGFTVRPLWSMRLWATPRDSQPVQGRHRAIAQPQALRACHRAGKRHL